jgi:hypothetical protein
MAGSEAWSDCCLAPSVICAAVEPPPPPSPSSAVLGRSAVLFSAASAAVCGSEVALEGGWNIELFLESSSNVAER